MEKEREDVCPSSRKRQGKSMVEKKQLDLYKRRRKMSLVRRFVLMTLTVTEQKEREEDEGEEDAVMRPAVCPFVRLFFIQLPD